MVVGAEAIGEGVAGRGQVGSEAEVVAGVQSGPGDVAGVLVGDPAPLAGAPRGDGADPEVAGVQEAEPRYRRSG